MVGPFDIALDFNKVGFKFLNFAVAVMKNGVKREFAEFEKANGGAGGAGAAHIGAGEGGIKTLGVGVA